MGGDWEDPENNEGNDFNDGWRSQLGFDCRRNGAGLPLMHQASSQAPQQVVSVGKLGIDVSMDGGKHWTHVSDSSQYVARISPDGRILWMAGNRHICALRVRRILTEADAHS